MVKVSFNLSHIPFVAVRAFQLVFPSTVIFIIFDAWFQQFFGGIISLICYFILVFLKFVDHFFVCLYK
jgi:hypothetical protein